MKNRQLEKELKKHNINLTNHNVELCKENERLKEERTKLLFRKKECHDLKNKLIEEYFLNTNLKRKETEINIENKKNQKLIQLEIIKAGVPMVDSIIKYIMQYAGENPNNNQEPKK